MTTKTRTVATFAALVLLLVSVPVAIATAATSPTPATNPDLAASCGTDVTIVIDRSGSIGGNNATVQAAAQTFNDAMIGTGSKVQLLSFSDRATAEPGSGDDLSDLAFVDPADLDVPTFNSSGTTNWDDALEMVRRSPAGHAPLTVVITDGDPTRRNEDEPDGHGGDLEGNGTTTQADLDAAVAEANLIKAQPAHLFVVGVGSAISNANSKARLQAISGPDELTFSGETPSIEFGKADFTLVQDFTNLKTTVARFVRELCGPSLNVVKQLQLANGQTVAAGAADVFSFDVSLAPTPLAWTAPSPHAGATATLATTDGVANFAWDPATPSGSTTITLGEQAKAGWVYNGQRCWLNNLDGTPAQLVVNDVGANVIGASKPATGHVLPAVGPYQAMNCEVFNRQVRTATVSVDKVTVPGGRPEAFSFSLRKNGDTVASVPGMTDATSATSFGPVAPGTYDVVEADTAHFTKTAASCNDLATQAVEQVSPTGLVLAEGSAWQCTFTNTLNPGSIRIIKDLQGAPSGTFDFTSNIPGHTAFQLHPTAAVDAFTTFAVPAGSYAVAEGPHGPFALNATCNNNSDPAHILVSPDVQTTCTFTNSAPPPTITVAKSASVPAVAEPGDDVTYTVAITNSSVEPLVLTKLTDSISGGDDDGSTIDIFDLPGADTTCLPLEGQPIAPLASVDCTFVLHVSGNAGQTVVDTVEAEATDSDANVAKDDDEESVRITDVAPSLTVGKATTTPAVPEPGGIATYNVSVTNTSPSGEAVTLTSLTDKISGGPALNLTIVAAPITATTCGAAVGHVLVFGATYSCSFSATVSGDAGDIVTDVVRADAVDDDGTSTNASDDAQVTLTDVLPEISITKSAAPTAVAEPGDDVTFTVGIHNDKAEAIEIDSISDSVAGGAPFAAGGTCAALVGTTLGGGASTSCTFVLAVEGDASDGPVSDTVTVTASDNEDHSTEDTASASVAVTDVLPTIVITKSASPTSVDEPGAVVTFTVNVTNTSVESVVIDAILDRVDGGDPIDVTTLPGTCAALVGDTLGFEDSTSCTFQLFVSGNGGDDVDDEVAVSAGDDDGNQVTETAMAEVSVDDVLPVISVTKDADVASVPEPSGAVTYTVTLTNGSIEAVTITDLSDVVEGGPELDVTAVDGTTCVLPQVLPVDDDYTCSFTLDVGGNAGDTVEDEVTATATDDDGNEVTEADTAEVALTDVLPSITVSKTATTTEVDAPGGPADFEVTVVNTSPEPVTITSIVDTIGTGDDATEIDLTAVGDLVTATTCEVGGELAAAGEEGDTYTCTFTLELEGNEAAEIEDTVTVTVTDDEENEATDDDDASVELAAVADLAIEKEATVVPTVDFTGAYTLRVTNLGPSTATDVSVTDLLPEFLTATAAAGDGWTCVLGDTVTCTRPALAPGLAPPIVIEVAVGDPGVNVPITNTATVSSPVPDPDPTNNSDSVTLVPSRLLDASSPPVVSSDLPRTGAGLRGWVIAADIFLILGVLAMFADARRRRLA